MKKLNKLLSLLFIISILSTNAVALQKENIKEHMSNSIIQVTSILKDKLNKEEKSKKIFKLLDEVFDYKLMSKISLGRNYKKLSDKQKDDFALSFENKLKSSYMSKLDLYTDQITNVNELKVVKKNRLMLYTKLVGDTNTFDINYKFYKNKKNDWLIYDIELLGVSTLQTYRKQFKTYLQNHSIDDLIKNM